MTEPVKNNRRAEQSADAIWDFFCSLKLTIITLLSLAVLSIIGTLIQQNAEPAEYIREYGQQAYEWFVRLQFIDMYHSWWFVGLIGLFCINLICCTINNFPRAWKFFQQPQLIPGEGLLNNSANRFEVISTQALPDLAKSLEASLKKEFSRPKRTEKDGKVYLFAQKGIYSRLGAYVTHLSLLIIIVGALIGNFWGYKAYVNIAEGTSANRVWSEGGQFPIDLDFTVRCDDFDVSYYAGSRRPKEYTSDLVILENGREIVKKRIEVNEPLTYKGITFYQSSYGSTGDAFFRLQATENSSGQVTSLNARQGEPVELPGGASLTITNFTENDRRFGPAIQLSVSDPEGKSGNPFVVWQKYPQFDVKRGGAFSFALIGFEQTMYTGLQVAKDPGVEVVWLGCLLLIFGSMTAFFVSHKRIWICLEGQDQQTRIRVAGNAHRNQPGYAMAFEALQLKLEAAIENSSPEKEG